MLRNEIINAARGMLKREDLANFSINKLLFEMQLSKGAFYSEFSNKTDLIAAIIIDNLLTRYNTGTYILNRDDLNPFEQLCLFSTIGIEKTLSNQHDIGTLFLLPKRHIWHDLPEETRVELSDAFSRLYRFVDRVLLEAPQLALSSSRVDVIRTKLNALERGLLIGQMNIVSPDSHLTLHDLINIISEDICTMFLCHRDCIDEDKIFQLTLEFFNMPPNWAAAYRNE